MEIKEKLEKDKETLTKLKEKKVKIEEKIKKLEESIEYNTMILDQRKFSEVNNVLEGKALSIDEILKAIQNGDLLSLQEKLENANKTTIESSTNEDSVIINKDETEV